VVHLVHLVHLVQTDWMLASECAGLDACKLVFNP